MDNFTAHRRSPLGRLPGHTVAAGGSQPLDRVRQVVGMERGGIVRTDRRRFCAGRPKLRRFLAHRSRGGGFLPLLGLCTPQPAG